MRQMFSKRQIEELSKLAIAGASNEDKQNFIPEIELKEITSESLNIDLSNHSKYELINIVLTASGTAKITLPSFIVGVIQINSLDQNCDYFISNIFNPSQQAPFVDKESEGAVLDILLLDKIAFCLISDNY